VPCGIAFELHRHLSQLVRRHERQVIRAQLCDTILPVRWQYYLRAALLCRGHTYLVALPLNCVRTSRSSSGGMSGRPLALRFMTRLSPQRYIHGNIISEQHLSMKETHLVALPLNCVSTSRSNSSGRINGSSFALGITTWLLQKPYIHNNTISEQHLTLEGTHLVALPLNCISTSLGSSGGTSDWRHQRQVIRAQLGDMALPKLLNALAISPESSNSMQGAHIPCGIAFELR
jgi:hypothetical protein